MFPVTFLHSHSSPCLGRLPARVDLHRITRPAHPPGRVAHNVARRAGASVPSRPAWLVSVLPRPDNDAELTRGGGDGGHCVPVAAQVPEGAGAGGEAHVRGGVVRRAPAAGLAVARAVRLRRGDGQAAQIPASGGAPAAPAGAGDVERQQVDGGGGGVGAPAAGGRAAPASPALRRGDGAAPQAPATWAEAYLLVCARAAP